MKDKENIFFLTDYEQDPFKPNLNPHNSMPSRDVWYKHKIPFMDRLNIVKAVLRAFGHEV